MCQLCVDAALDPRSAVKVFALRAAEARLVERTIKRRKARVIEKPTASLTRELRRLLRVEAARVIDLMRGTELPYTPRPAKEAQAFSVDDYLRMVLMATDLTPYEAALLENYRDIAPGAMEDILQQVRRRVGVDPVALIANPRAQEWIKAHAIEFSKRWAGKVTATTNKAIRDALAQGWAQFESTEELIGRVKKVYADASDHRAETIARTESSRAYNSSTAEMSRELGATGKFWIISGSPYSYVDVCSDNAAMKVIPVNGSFRDIGGMPIDGPPAHPNCLCDIGFEFDEAKMPSNLLEG